MVLQSSENEFLQKAKCKPAVANIWGLLSFFFFFSEVVSIPELGDTQGSVCVWMEILGKPGVRALFLFGEDGVA